jgi:hypothetical protein
MKSKLPSYFTRKGSKASSNDTEVLIGSTYNRKRAIKVLSVSTMLVRVKKDNEQCGATKKAQPEHPNPY